jgi:diguanylate cyclase (GGDEF)-like protein
LKKSLLAIASLGALLALGALGLFLDPAPGWRGPRSAGDRVLQVLFLLLLLGGLLTTMLRFASKRRSRRDDAALLVVLVVGVNFLVQLSGGPASAWQALYLVLVCLTAIAYPARLLAVAVGAVLVLEGGNWALRGGEVWGDFLRNTALLLASAGAAALLQRGERRRAERTEGELQKLNLGLERLSDEESASPLSEEGKRRGRAEHVVSLNRQLLELLKLARKATGAHGAVLLQIDPAERVFHLRSAAGEGLDLVGSEPLPVGAVLAEALRKERALSLSESERPLPALPWYRVQPEIHSLIAAPILDRGAPGWILALDHPEPGRFGPGEKELVVDIAGQLGEWIRSTRWLAELDVLSREFQRLYQASARLTEARRVEEILKQVLLFCGEVSAFETCAICLVTESGDEFTVPVAEGYPRSVSEQRLSLESPTWAGWILRSREEPLVIRFTRRTGMPILYPGEKARREVSFLGVPLVAKRSVNGALLLTRAGAPFSASEVRVLRILCNQAAVAVENARVYERVEQMAATDGLTGLFNRRFFEEALVRELARADREEGRLALLLLDIDHFKQLNDTYGHTMGDLVLKQVAAVLRSTLRKGDVLARFGGEEFVIVLPSASIAGAHDFAERVRRAVASSSIHPGGARRKVTVSGGWAIFPDDASGSEELIERADRALYAAKEGGRNRMVGYHELKPEWEPTLGGTVNP